MKYFHTTTTLIEFLTNQRQFLEIAITQNLARPSKFESNFSTYLFFLVNLNKKSKLKTNKHRSIVMNKFFSESLQFIKIFNKDGLLQKYYLLINSLLIMHRQFFEKLNIFFNTQYQNYHPFHVFAKTNYNFYKLSFLLNFVTTILDPCIQVKVITLPKFIQKKYRKKYDFQIKHVHILNRKRYVFKRIVLNSNFINYLKIQYRLYLALINIFLKPDSNLVYNEKINFYRYALKVYKAGLLKLGSL
jgi:hypothetical protein